MGSLAPEVRIAALLDLAENAVLQGDLDKTHTGLDAAAGDLRGDLVFGWRLDFKLQLIRSRLALAEDARAAFDQATTLAVAAERLGVPRYASIARLVRHRAGLELGLPVDHAAIEADLDLAERSVAIEAWWWAGELGSVIRIGRWIDRAEAGAAGIRRDNDADAGGFERCAAGLIHAWRAR